MFIIWNSVYYMKYTYIDNEEKRTRNAKKKHEEKNEKRKGGGARCRHRHVAVFKNGVFEKAEPDTHKTHSTNQHDPYMTPMTGNYASSSNA